jgi:putative transposase
MVQDQSSQLIHAVFSTKEFGATIPAYLLEHLWSLSGLVARQHGMKALAVGGSTNYMHVLLSVPANQEASEALQTLKIHSANFLNEHMTDDFEWQDGYGAFSVVVAENVSASVIKARFVAGRGIALGSAKTNA